MSEEDSPDLTKSWVFVDPKEGPQASGVEEVPENDNHVDSDTDSISVISESGCSYRTDEEEFAAAPASMEAEEGAPSEVAPPSEPAPEVTEVEPAPEVTEVEPPSEPPKPQNEAVEKLLYFATSAACALVLVGFSIVVQHYFNGSSNVHKFAADLDRQSVHHYVQNVKSPEVASPVKRYSFRRKREGRFEDGAVRVDNLHEKIALPSAQIENNDLRVEGDVKSNYKLSKNKSPATKCNKENCDDSEKRTKNDDFKRKIKSDFNKDGKRYKKEDRIGSEDENDENCDKKIKELKIKEDYLKEKEKFLIEKEHHLMKKEIKLKNYENNEKQSYGKKKYEKKTYINKKEKEHNKHSSEEDNKEKKDKYKHQKKYFDESNNPKSNKKYKNKEDKKRHHDQNNQHRIVDDSQHKKRNISGQWYIDLHKARNNIRQKEHASDWVFDRAHLRSLKRNKAHWYFQWMVDRARLRVK